MDPFTSKHVHESSSASKPSVVDAVFDTALAWVDRGLAHLKASLDASARAIERAAAALDNVRDKLRA